MRLLFFGDCMFGRGGAPFDENPFRYVGSFIREADFIFFNLETVISPQTLSEAHKEPKTFNYQSKGKQLKMLRNMTQATIFASIANNHSLDYGLHGLEATEEYLKKTEILFNQGDNPVTQKGITFLSATDHCGCNNLKKWGENVWVIDYNNLEPVLRKIWRIRQTAPLRGAPSGFIVFSIHWGSNWVTRIPPKIKQLGRALIDAGVNVVFGHSAHHVPPEPVEFYKGGLIIYGLGDFVNDYAIDPDFQSDKAFMCTISGAPLRGAPSGLTKYPLIYSWNQVRATRRVRLRRY